MILAPPLRGKASRQKRRRNVSGRKERGEKKGVKHGRRG